MYCDDAVVMAGESDTCRDENVWNKEEATVSDAGVVVPKLQSVKAPSKP